jgi:hypothetical protein
MTVERELAEIDRVMRGRPRLQRATDGRWELALLHTPLPLSLRALKSLLERLAETARRVAYLLSSMASKAGVGRP